MPIPNTRMPDFYQVIPAVDAPNLPHGRYPSYIVFLDADGDPIDIGGGGGPVTVAWADVSGKPSTFPPTIGTTASTAAAGNHTHAVANITGLQTALDAKLTGSKAPAQANSTATDVAGLVADFNALLAKLRTAGVITT
ncbi:hypothetical protein PAEVO_03820 [Paenibacillus sp. GM2FR]|uniref:head fiber protein n=1 Tax=Paenibacillus sp. GM2FR TaxID=2059268 RepID=UPI000CC4C991|nr:head fiber protein [Paenibacillus sp. GM2FR]PJN53661.1 hypothetical protein PAEVO_03820 [Paenibacillus sp. GM2FR]